jgi:Carboxypeptidase regulatory-like domain
VNAATGEPIHHAAVAILSEEDSHTVAAVESDNDGHFSLDHLPAAKYQLTASKRGFRTAFYDEHQEFNSAIVTGPGQETGNLVFRLVPGAVLRGTITTDGGDPVENARVMLFIKARDGKPGTRITQSDSTTSDDTGAYEFSNLAAGEYLLAVFAEPWYALRRPAGHSTQLNPNSADSVGSEDPATALDVVYPITFFDSTTDEASASRITLAGGSRAQADIVLHAVPSLRIQVDTPLKQDGSIARAELRQTVFGTVIGAESAGFLDSMRTGTTEFAGVAPGHYELVQGDPPRMVDLDPSANLEVDPAAGTLTATVRGALRNTAGAALTDECSLSLEPVDTSRSQSPVESVCVRGAFTIPSVPAGQWKVSAESGGKPLSVVAVTMDAHTHAGNLVTVQDRPLNITVTLSQGATRVQGFARRDGKGVAGVMIVLVPREIAALDGLMRRDQSDSDGSFSLRDVVPGNYTLVAIEDGWTLDWAQPQVIARYLPGGIPVTVTDSSGKLVTLAAPVPVQTR